MRALVRNAAVAFATVLVGFLVPLSGCGGPVPDVDHHVFGRTQGQDPGVAGPTVPRVTGTGAPDERGPLKASTPGAGISIHASMGLPDDATTEVDNPEHYLSVKAQYVLSYNSTRRTPNWVSWELNAAYFGSATRSNTFRPDDTLPPSLAQAQLTDYSGSGYDRGHMCPSMDRTATPADNSNTFYLTNMVPQADNNNAGPWEKLEMYSKGLATSGKELFITTGGVYGEGASTIGSGVAVPTATYAVIVVLDEPGQGPLDVTTSTRVIGIIMPNDNTAVVRTDPWQPFRVAVHDIEAETGLHFLSDVPAEIRDVLEAEVDSQ